MECCGLNTGLELELGGQKLGEVSGSLGGGGKILDNKENNQWGGELLEDY